MAAQQVYEVVIDDLTTELVRAILQEHIWGDLGDLDWDEGRIPEPLWLAAREHAQVLWDVIEEHGTSPYATTGSDDVWARALVSRYAYGRRPVIIRDQWDRLGRVIPGETPIVLSSLAERLERIYDGLEDAPSCIPMSTEIINELARLSLRPVHGLITAAESLGVPSHEEPFAIFVRYRHWDRGDWYVDVQEAAGLEELEEEFPFVLFRRFGPSAETYLYCPAYVPSRQVWCPGQHIPHGTPDHVPPGDLLMALFHAVVAHRA